MNLSAIRWDTFIQNITLMQPNLITPVNLTWSSLKLSIKRNYNNPTYTYTWSMTIVSAVSGNTRIEIPATVTTLWQLWDWYYDVELTDSNWKVDTVLKWVFKILYDVTR
jgi:hypothetical protein